MTSYFTCSPWEHIPSDSSRGNSISFKQKNRGSPTKCKTHKPVCFNELHVS